MIKIAITVNKNDVWFCRICIASIRYYYPQVEIFLIKDELNGKFSTREIEKNWNIGIIKFDQKIFGWSAAKIFFYTDKRFSGQYFLVLDSDIVFTGRLLDKLESIKAGFDAIVSSEIEVNPYAEWVTKTYFDLKKVEEFNSKYKYPGYFFNAGQIVVKGGLFEKSDLADFFDFDKYPYWKNLRMFPLVDQSLLNYLFPIFSAEGKIKVNSDYKYMIWSETDEVRNIDLQDLVKNTYSEKLIHWAGAKRTPILNKMSGGALLNFYENYYYNKIRFGFIKRYLRRFTSLINSYYKRIINKIWN